MPQPPFPNCHRIDQHSSMLPSFERLELETALPDEHDNIIAEGTNEIMETLDRLDELESNPEKVPYTASNFTVQVKGERFIFTPHDGGFRLSEVNGSEVTEQAFATGQIEMPYNDPDVRSALESLVFQLNIAPQSHHGRKN